jgi:hypothetical protein
MDDNRRGSKHVSFMEHRSGLVRSQTTSSFEESSAHMGPAARWRMAAARSQERLLDGPMIKPKKQPCYVAHQEDGPKPNKTVIMGEFLKIWSSHNQQNVGEKIEYYFCSIHHNN